MLGRVAWYLATILIAIIFLRIQRADEEATRLYQEFVDSFKGDDVPGGKAFMRGETINPDDLGKTGIEGLHDQNATSGKLFVIFYFQEHIAGAKLLPSLMGSEEAIVNMLAPNLMEARIVLTNISLMDTSPELRNLCEKLLECMSIPIDTSQMQKVQRSRQ